MRTTCFLLSPCLIIAVLIGLVGVIVGPSSAEAARKKLTCSYIAKQCSVGCGKEAPPVFCNEYCLGERQKCLRTGQWLGMRRTFRSVIRK